MSFQFFFIKSRMHGKVMDIEGESRDPGTHVIMYEKKDHSMDNINQLWYEDSSSRTIRSALHDMCLSLDGDNELIVEPFNGSSVQEWERDGDKIRNRNDGQVVDISGENEDDGARMCKYSEHGGTNQQWDFEFIHGNPPAAMAGQYHHGGHHSAQHGGYGGEAPRPPSPAHSSSSSSSSSEDEKEEEESEPRYFYIRSAMHGKVLDVSGSNRDPGAEVIVWPANDSPSDNQLWYTAGGDIIRSKLNGYALDCVDGDLKLYPVNDHSPTQGFRMEGNRIVSKHDGRAVDIAGENQDDGAHVCAWEQHGNTNQQWEFQHI